jgi:hypothetical protein
VAAEHRFLKVLLELLVGIMVEAEVAARQFLLQDGRVAPAQAV